MIYLNVQASGLSGSPHPVLHQILTTQDVKKARSHVKFLCGDVLTGERLHRDQGISPHCHLCLYLVETTEHVLLHCRSTYEVRERLLTELLNAVAAADPCCFILTQQATPYFVQFILDCTSLNLPNHFRLSPQNPKTYVVIKTARDWCHGVLQERGRQLKSLKNIEGEI